MIYKFTVNVSDTANEDDLANKLDSEFSNHEGTFLHDNNGVFISMIISVDATILQIKQFCSDNDLTPITCSTLKQRIALDGHEQIDQVLQPSDLQ